MYGMVNNALQALTLEKLGEQAWLQACSHAGHSDGFFLSLETYPDSVTYQLVGKLSELFELSPTEFLELFGKYWISYAQTTSYAPLLQSFKNLEECLTHLNAMHQRIAHTLSNLNAPTFTFDPEAKGGILIYQSNRAGLTPFVVGLLKGLAEMYKQPIKITLMESSDGFAKFSLEY